MIGKRMDLKMLVVHAGRERTEVEFRRLFGAAAFRLIRIDPTASDVSVEAEAEYDRRRRMASCRGRHVVALPYRYLGQGQRALL